MPFVTDTLGKERPQSLWVDFSLPRREKYYPSPADWRNETLYFLLVDRFSDAKEDQRPLLDRGKLPAARRANGEAWRWDEWADSGQGRWQGGTIDGVTSKLDYLQKLGITAIWLSPIFKQRIHLDTYHGYGIQDFLDVDPRFGNRQHLVELVRAAHERGMRVILDVIYNHSGDNWCYRIGDESCVDMPGYSPGRFDFGHWRGADGSPIQSIASKDDGVWPKELQDPDDYTRAGLGRLDARPDEIDDPYAEHKRTDFMNLRDFDLTSPGVLTDLARCYKYWIALTDCDGFRIDTLKHVSLQEARNFCGSIKEFAVNLGKDDFFLLGEVAGGDYNQDRYLDVVERNLNATLDIGELKLNLNSAAKGFAPGRNYFGGFTPVEERHPDCSERSMGSHRGVGNRHISILDDHDHVWGTKLRFSVDAASEVQVSAATAIQLFSLGIPCIYYGTEVALAGPEPSERQWLPGWGNSDRYLREAMFGPEHPRADGAAGVTTIDKDLPGFGPFGTAGHHCFDINHPAFKRISAMAKLRSAYPVLRSGRQYQRKIAHDGGPFLIPERGGLLLAWSRILDDEEMLCLVNPNGIRSGGGKINVDANLSASAGSIAVVYNSDESDEGRTAGSLVDVRRADDGTAFVEMKDIRPSQVILMTNAP